jgi:chromosome segregation ATPase
MEEILKDLVIFNRYKSVESFNNATDVTSGTISIVKIDENVMDIYLGRTQLTHSNFPEVNIELRNLINSLESRLCELETELDSYISEFGDTYIKDLSEKISDFKIGLNDLIIVTNNLSNEIAEINTKHISSTNDIVKLKQDVKSLKIEDNHIFETLSDLENKLNNITNNNVISDVKQLKDDINLISNNNISLRNDITSVKNNISNINTILSKRLNITESDIVIIKKDITELETILKGIDITNTDISPIISDINNIKKKINDVSNELLDKIEDNISEINKLKSRDISVMNDISDMKRDISALKIEDNHIFELVSELQSINKSIIFDINLIKNDNSKISEEILLIKEKIQYLTGVDIDSFVSLEEAKRRLTSLENADKEFQKTINDLNKSISEDTKNIYDDIESIKERIEYLSGVDFEALKDVNQRFVELEKKNDEIQKNIEEINESIKNGIDTKLKWLIL